MPNIENWLQTNHYADLIQSQPVGGGSISRAARLILADGSSWIAKSLDQAPHDFFQAEAQGLNSLRAHTSLRIPKVIQVNSDFILLEDLGSGSPGPCYWTDLAEGLAELHSSSSDRFGLCADNYCGSTPQINEQDKDGFQFYAQCRIVNLARQAEQRSLLTSKDMADLDYIVENLSRWIPEQPPVLIHGDLWSGNVHCDEYRNPALIDPAVYWGWAEAELAMTLLFGGFSRQFYDHYSQVSGMDKDWTERAPLYNLYHLLNHLLLFGSSYAAQIRSAIRKYR